MAYIEIRNLSKKFRDNVVLDNVDLDINRGEVVALIGPSGTGKSTLLRCLNRLENPESGTVSFEGKKYDLTTKKSRLKRELRQHTEMVFQQFNLLKNKNVLKNVTEGLKTVKKIGREEAEQIAYRELGKVGMIDRLTHYPRHLSGGQQQRVAIARALAMDPQLLLMDEPTSALDPELVGEVLMIIKKIAQEGNTILLVTHEMDFVKGVADRVVFLENGRIVTNGTAREVFENPRDERLKQFLIKVKQLDGSEYVI